MGRSDAGCCGCERGTFFFFFRRGGAVVRRTRDPGFNSQILLGPLLCGVVPMSACPKTGWIGWRPVRGVRQGTPDGDEAVEDGWMGLGLRERPERVVCRDLWVCCCNQRFHQPEWEAFALFQCVSLSVPPLPPVLPPCFLVCLYLLPSADFFTLSVCPSSQSVPAASILHVNHFIRTFQPFLNDLASLRIKPDFGAVAGAVLSRVVEVSSRATLWLQTSRRTQYAAPILREQRGNRQ